MFIKLAVAIGAPLLVVLWGSASARLYRTPILLFLLGVFVGLISLFGDAAIANVSNVLAIPSGATDAKVAQLMISVLCSATAGSLIAASVVLQSQKLHEEELRKASESLERLSVEVEKIDDDIRSLKSDPDGEEDRYAEWLRRLKAEMRAEIRELRDFLKRQK